MSVKERLQARLSKVPGVTSSDLDMWVDESVNESGYTDGENDNAVFYLALAIAYETIAGDAARYFSFTDRDEVVDKTNIFDNYMKLADKARKNYRKSKRGKRGAAFQTHPKRADHR